MTKPCPTVLNILMCVLSTSVILTLCNPMDCIACQAPLSMGFSRQEYWRGLPCPPLLYLPDPGIEPMSLMFSELAGGFFNHYHHLEVHEIHLEVNNSYN